MIELQKGAIAFMTFLLLLYLVFCYVRFGFLKSISYSTEKLKRREQIYFFWFTMAISLPALVFVFNPFKWLLFSAILCISFVGVFSALKKKFVYFVHVVLAVSGIILAMASLWIDFYLWYIPVLVAVFCVLFVVWSKNPLYWIEVVCILHIYLGLSLTIYV
jgi:hypothetical protein